MTMAFEFAKYTQLNHISSGHGFIFEQALELGNQSPV